MTALRDAFLTCLLLGAACARVPPSVAPAPRQAARLPGLAGKWEGSYRAERIGEGKLHLRLVAAGDSAYGTVTMFPPAKPPAAAPGAPQPLRAAHELRIVFLRCEHSGILSGMVDPDEDPETGERIYATFDGRLSANGTLKGSFQVYYAGSSLLVSGEWTVSRRFE